MKCPRCKDIEPIEIMAIGDRIGYFCRQYGHWIRWMKTEEMKIGLSNGMLGIVVRQAK